jgi:hypothetical protein
MIIPSGNTISIVSFGAAWRARLISASMKRAGRRLILTDLWRSFRLPLLDPFREADADSAQGDNANENGPQSRQPFLMRPHGAFRIAHFR